LKKDKTADNLFLRLYLKYYNFIAIILVLTIIPISLKIKDIEKGFSQKIWFQKKDNRLKMYNQFQAKYGSDDVLILALDFNETIIKKSNLVIIKNLTESMSLLPGVSKVESLTNHSRIHGENDDIFIEPIIKQDETISNQTVNKVSNILKSEKDLKNLYFDDSSEIAIIYARMYPIQNSLKAYQKTVKELKEQLSDLNLPKSVDVHISGNVSMAVGFNEISSQDIKKLIPIALVILFVSLLIFLKDIKAVLIALIIAFLTISTTLGIQAILNIKTTLITLMVPSILLAIVVSDCVHILSSYIKNLKILGNSKDNIKATIKKNILPTFLTSLTTAVGFFSLTSSSLAPISDLGTLITIGVFVAWIFSIFIIPFLLTIFKLNSSINREKNYLGRFKSIIPVINKRKNQILIFCSFIFLTSLYLASKNQVNSNIIKYFDSELPIRTSAEFLNSKAGGIGTVELIIEPKENKTITNPNFLKKVDNVLKEIKLIEGVKRVNSLIPILKKSNQVLHGGKESQYLIPSSAQSIAEQLFLYDLNAPVEKNLSTYKNTGDSEMRVSIQTNQMSSKGNSDLVENIKNKLNTSELNYHLTGKSILMQDLDSYIIKTFFTSILQAMFLITLMMCLMFRSIKFGILAMIPNVFPPVLGAALLYLFNIPLDVGTILIVSTSLGIAVDDTIFFLTSLNKHSKDTHCMTETLEKVFEDTFSPLLTTTITLISSFGVFVLGSFEPNQNFGLMTAIVLFLALIADFIILPAVLLTFNKSS